MNPRASIAQGMAAVAVLVTFGALLGSLARRMPAHVESPPPVCGTHVEVREQDGVRLGCASEESLRRCGALLSGDAAVIGPDGTCERLPAAMPAATRLAVGVPLDVNRATASELELLSGVGPKLAGAIVAERERRGGFRTVDELVLVKGIGPKTLTRLQPHLVVSPPSLGVTPR